MASKRSVKPGDRYGRLVLVRFIDKVGQRLNWKVRCDCGAVVIRDLRGMWYGHTSSCGCLRREVTGRRATKHGAYGTPEHQSWRGMWDRCTNRGHQAYRHYGGRGITISKRWRDFNNFFADMGKRPPGLTLERKNNNGNYNKRNCKWATRTEQVMNCRAFRVSIKVKIRIRALSESGVPRRELLRRFPRAAGVLSHIIYPKGRKS